MPCFVVCHLPVLVAAVNRGQRILVWVTCVVGWTSVTVGAEVAYRMEAGRSEADIVARMALESRIAGSLAELVGLEMRNRHQHMAHFVEEVLLAGHSCKVVCHSLVEGDSTLMLQEGFRSHDEP